MSVLFDILLVPFKGINPLWGLLWISSLSGIMMILLFKRFSNQQAIAAVRRTMGSRALGMLLYLESPLTVVKLALRLITDNFVYLWHLLFPMLVIALPFLLVAGQLDARYAKLPPGDQRPLAATVRYEQAVPRLNPADAESGEIVSPVVTVGDSLELSFSFTAGEGLFLHEAAGVRLGTTGGSGSIVVRGSGGSGFTRFLFTPWLTAPPEGVQSVSGYLQGARYSVLGGRWSWFAVFIVFSSIWAVLGAVVFRVKV